MLNDVLLKLLSPCCVDPSFFCAQLERFSDKYPKDTSSTRCFCSYFTKLLLFFEREQIEETKLLFVESKASATSLAQNRSSKDGSGQDVLAHTWTFVQSKSKCKY